MWSENAANSDPAYVDSLSCNVSSTSLTQWAVLHADESGILPKYIGVGFESNMSQGSSGEAQVFERTRDVLSARRPIDTCADTLSRRGTGGLNTSTVQSVSKVSVPSTLASAGVVTGAVATGEMFSGLHPPQLMPITNDVVSSSGSSDSELSAINQARNLSPILRVPRASPAASHSSHRSRATSAVSHISNYSVAMITGVTQMDREMWRMNATQQQGEREERRAQMQLLQEESKARQQREWEERKAQQQIEREERRREHEERAAQQQLLVCELQRIQTEAWEYTERLFSREMEAASKLQEMQQQLLHEQSRRMVMEA